MNQAAEDEIKRLTAAMDGPASFEPTIRAAMEFAYRDAISTVRSQYGSYGDETVEDQVIWAMEQLLK